MNQLEEIKSCLDLRQEQMNDVDFYQGLINPLIFNSPSCRRFNEEIENKSLELFYCFRTHNELMQELKLNRSEDPIFQQKVLNLRKRVDNLFKPLLKISIQQKRVLTEVLA